MPAISTENPFSLVERPFQGGERVIVVVNEHYWREPLDLTGRRRVVSGVYPYPSDRIMPVGIVHAGPARS